MNKDTIAMRPRVLYFVVFAYFSFTGGRFTATFLEHELRFSENWMISVAMAVQILSSSLCSSWLGGLADSWEASMSLKGGGKNRGRLMVMSLGLLLSTVATLLHGLGSLYMRWTTTGEEEKGDAAINPSLDDTIDGIEATGMEDSQQTIPPLMLAYHLTLRAMFAVSNTAIMPALDGLTLATLTDKTEYGKERMYGAISWAIAHLTFGPLIDHFGFSVLYATTILSCVGGIATFRLFAMSSLKNRYVGVDEKVDSEEDSAHASETNDEHKPPANESIAAPLPPPRTGSKFKSRTSFVEGDDQFENDSSGDPDTENEEEERLTFSDLVRLLLQKAPTLNASYVASLFALYIGMSVVERLIFLYFEFLGGSNTMCAVTVVVTVLFEIPLFNFAPDVLRLFGSPKLLQWACVAYVVRVVGYSFVPKSHPYLVLFLEPLHGITIAFATTSSVAFADEWVPTGYEASGQGFMSMIRGLGQFFGLCIGGFLEGRTLYRVLAVIVALGGSFLAIGKCLATSWAKIEGGQSTPVSQPQEQELKVAEIT